MKKAENVRVAENLCRLLSSLSVRYKYRVRDLFAALPYLMSLPAPQVFKAFDRIRITPAMLEELDEIMFLYKKLDDKGLMIMIESMALIDKIDEYEGRDYEIVKVII